MKSHRRDVLCLLLLATACQPAGGDDDDRPGDPGGNRRGAFFLPTTVPDNTAAPSVAVDSSGNVHAVYPAFAGGGAYYAHCAAGCRGPEDVRVVRFDTEGTVANAMIALDATGRPQVLLSAFASVYYAACQGNCTEPGGWTTSRILDHGGDRDVTGRAFAVDAAGRPRFLMHTTVAYLGVGQKAPATHWVACDGDCLSPASWSSTVVADQIWRSSTLKLDGTGRAHVGTVALVLPDGQGASTEQIGAYLTCAGSCDRAEAWLGQGLHAAFEGPLDAVPIAPAISLALTAAGAPRLAIMGQDEQLQRHISYWSCDADCAEAPWQRLILLDGKGIGPGLELVLDAADRPRLAHTFDYSIGLAYCDASSCADPDAAWNLHPVERASDLAPDGFYLYPNCVVSSWFFHGPSLALSPRGDVHVGYQARDISGGWQNPDPVHTPDCVAGTDMSWTRLAVTEVPR